MTLSIGPATDYLVALAVQAVTGLTVGGEPFQVVDGEPDQLSKGMFVIGVASPPPDENSDTTGTRDWSGSGARLLGEDFTIPNYIDVIIPGSRTQKTVRDAAEAAFNAFAALHSADPSLGGMLVGGGYSTIGDVVSTPRNVGTAAEPGRRQIIAFGVHVTNMTR